MWLRSPTSEVVKNRGRKERLREVADKLAKKEKRGVLVVVNDGELHEFFDTMESAIEWLRDLYSRGLLRNSLIKPLGERKVSYLEIGGGVDELFGELRRE